MSGNKAPVADETLLSGAERAAAPAQELPAGAVLSGRYEIVSRLGDGAMGSVYRARDLELGEVVALKVLKRELVQEQDMVERFRLEVKLARRVTHRNVARTFDIGEDAGDKFLTMELIEGEPLSHRMARLGTMPLSAILDIAGQICAGLAAAHEAGVVHRDLKPDNILLSQDGRVVITDFGIARAVLGAHRTQGHVVGTPTYMAPEQVEGAPDVDGRADLYALGCLLYEMCTGEPAWGGESAYAVALARLLRPPPDLHERRADVPAGLASIINRCLKRRPEDRLGSAGEVVQALSSLTQPAGLPAPARSGTWGTTRTAPAPRTLAVLPLRNGGPPEDDYLAEGLTEDLIDNLTMLPGLRVRPRGAVMAARGEPDPQAAGRQLGVEVVVEGSLRRTDKGLRVQVRLSSVADGFQLWAQRFERPAADVLAVGDEIAQAVAAALTGAATPAGPGSPRDPRQVDLYLRARHEYRKLSKVGSIRAVDLLDQALAIGAAEPELLAFYGVCRARLWFFGGEGSRELATRAAEQALLAAPGRGEPHLAMATVLYQAGDLPGAIRHLRQAMALAPGLAEAYELFGKILVETGPLDEGVHQLTMAMQLEPALVRAALDLARAHALRGDRDACARLLIQHRPQEENGPFLLTQARVALWSGDVELARDCLEHPDVRSGDLSTARALAEFVVSGKPLGGQRVEIVRWLDTPHSSDRSRAFFHQIRAELACAVGDPAEALLALADAAAAGLTDLIWLERCPLLAGLRGEAAFVALRAQVEARALAVQRAMREGTTGTLR